VEGGCGKELWVGYVKYVGGVKGVRQREGDSCTPRGSWRSS